MILAPCYIVASMKYCIQSGAVMDCDHWARTYQITPDTFAEYHQLARDEIAADIAENDAENEVRATLKCLPEAESEAA